MFKSCRNAVCTLSSTVVFEVGYISYPLCVEVLQKHCAYTARDSCHQSGLHLSSVMCWRDADICICTLSYDTALSKEAS